MIQVQQKRNQVTTYFIIAAALTDKMKPGKLKQH